MKSTQKQKVQDAKTKMRLVKASLEAAVKEFVLTPTDYKERTVVSYMHLYREADRVWADEFKALVYGEK